jgi:xanthine dehydrogenase molybdopterin-binding subunit B
MQGLGYVTTEQLVIDSKSGKLLTDNFSTYKIPTVHDMPDRVIQISILAIQFEKFLLQNFFSASCDSSCSRTR